MMMESAGLLGKGIYSLEDVAKLIGENPRRVRYWFRGLKRRSQKDVPPVFRPDHEPIDGTIAVSFLDLVEARVAAKLVKMGIAPRYVRRIHEWMSREFSEEHPFATKRLKSDGYTVVMEAMTKTGVPKFVQPITKQMFNVEICSQFLDNIDWDEAEFARSWRIAPGVVLDPTQHFGQPTTEKSGLLTYVVWETYKSNQENVETVARWFRAKPNEIEQAVEFERNHRKIAA